MRSFSKSQYNFFHSFANYRSYCEEEEEEEKNTSSSLIIHTKAINEYTALID
jgi:hypothetical protein